MPKKLSVLDMIAMSVFIIAAADVASTVYMDKSYEYKKVCKQSGGTTVFNGIKNECIVIKKQGE